MSYKNIKNKTAFITGAGSGIGQATAVLLAMHGAKVIATDINDIGLQQTQEKIDEFGGQLKTYILDVTDRKAYSALATKIHKQQGAIDILINNAGIATAGDFLSTSLATWDKVIDINFKGVINGCHYFLPPMVKAKQGTVINLSSLAAFVAPADMASYSASKFAVLGFSESLHADMAKHNIHVAAICPGIVNTGIIKNSIMEGALSQDNKQQKIDNFYQRRNYTPQKVAEAIIKAIIKKRRVLPVSPEAWLGYYLKRFSPGLVNMVTKIDQSNVFKK